MGIFCLGNEVSCSISFSEERSLITNMYGWLVRATPTFFRDVLHPNVRVVFKVVIINTMNGLRAAQSFVHNTGFHYV